MGEIKVSRENSNMMYMRHATDPYSRCQRLKTGREPVGLWLAPVLLGVMGTWIKAHRHAGPGSTAAHLSLGFAIAVEKFDGKTCERDSAYAVYRKRITLL
jgi:hypothetical protein